MRIGALALTILATRLPGGLLGGTDLLFNVDEMEMTLSTADRFLGVPSTSLAWPGATLQLIATPVFAFDYLVGSSFPKSPEGFARFLARLYREPWHAIQLVRVVVAVASSIGLALLLVPLQRMTRGTLAGLAGVAIVVTVPVMWLHAHMAMADALAISLGCAAMAAAGADANGSRTSAIAAGGLMGLALAAKLTSALFMPLVVAMVLAASRRPIRDAAAFAGGLALAFLLACPYVWVDPVRLAKSVIGTATRSGHAAGVWQASKTLAQIVSIPVLALSALGGYELWRTGQRLVLAGSVGSLAMLLAATSVAGIVYDRYFLAAMPPIAILTAMGLVVLGRVAERIPAPPRAALRAWVVVAAAALVCTNGAVAYRAATRGPRDRARQLIALESRLVALGPPGPIAIPKDLLHPLGKYLSSRSLRGWADRVPVASPERSLRGFAGRLSAGAVTVLGTALTEDEQAFAARLRAMAYPPARTGHDVVIWSVDDVAARLGLLTWKEAQQAMARGEVAALVADSIAPASKGLGAEELGTYRLILRRQEPDATAR